MTQRDRFYEDWLRSNEGLLAADRQDQLQSYIKNNPREYSSWLSMESQIQILNDVEWETPSTFESDVLRKINRMTLSQQNIQLSRIAFFGAAAMLVLMLNLVISQGTFSLDALIGISDMVVEDTNFIHYAN